MRKLHLAERDLLALKAQSNQALSRSQAALVCGASAVETGNVPDGTPGNEVALEHSNSSPPTPSSKSIVIVKTKVVPAVYE